MTAEQFDADTTAPDTPRHGDQRNRRHVAETETVNFETAGGTMPVTVVTTEYTASERWCEVCGGWVTARGIMGALLCVECGTPWDERFRE